MNTPGTFSVENTPALLLYMAAGACICLMIINRHLSRMRDSRFKVVVTALLLPGIMVALGLAWWFLPPKPWILMPGAVIVIAVLGEIERAAMRKIHAGSAPLDSVPHKVSLLRPLTSTDLVVHRYEITLSRWPGRCFRICHLSDMHLGSGFERSYYESVFSLAQETNPDLVLITGDFVSNARAIPEIAGLHWPRGKFGTYASLGNHEYWTDVNGVRTAVENADAARIVSGNATVVEVAGGRVGLVGWDYPWGMDKIMPGVPDADIVFLLSHTPDNVYRTGNRRVDCVFSGHFHAGQFRIPFLGSLIIPSVYGRRFDHGHFVIQGKHLFVTGGIGAVHLPFRIYCQPDIFVIDVTHG